MYHRVMCGRYTLTVSARILAEVFGAVVPDDYRPRFNIAPTQTVPIVRLTDHGSHRIDMLRWGLIPHWAKDPAIGNRMINARSETAPDKPAFRSAVAMKRCLVPADGFFEWTRIEGRKQPHHFRFSDRRVMTFGGLWASWRPQPDADWLESFTILTTSPNALVAPTHDRMPVILPPETWSEWLGPGELSRDRYDVLTGPHPPDDMNSVPVSTRVNSPANDDPDVLLA